MSTTLRFYAELNDFLAPTERQHDLVVSLSGHPAVKDVIEARGVPHTEVDVILVDGEPVGFGHRVADGERISVYPSFTRIDVAPVRRVGPEPLTDPRFVADVGLGKLARYLRLLGFDTLYRTDWGDVRLTSIAADELRVLLTRGRGLLKRNDVRHGMFVRDDDAADQLADVVRRLDLVDRLRPFTRCMSCNGLLAPVDKADIGDRLLPETREQVDDFHQCRSCGQLYWQGAHRSRLEELIERVRPSDGR